MSIRDSASTRRGPRLSIGLPVYNGQRYLEQSVRSILGQSFGDFELIICDNASTDGTRSIAEGFAGRDRRVRFYRNARNLGAARNFNLAFQHASAPHFKWACADDVLADGFLERAMEEFEGDPALVLCYGGVTLVDASGAPISAYDQHLDLRSPRVEDRFLRAREHSGYLHVLQGVLRSDALRRTGLMGAFPGSDETLMVELSLHGTFHEIPHPMLHRRMHEQAASASHSTEERQEHLDPRARGTFAPWYWRRAYEHLRGVARAPLPVAKRLALAASVLRSMIGGRDHLARELRDGLRWLRQRIASSERRLRLPDR